MYRKFRLVVMCGIVGCCVYLVIFLSVSSQVDSIPSRELGKAYARMHQQAVNLSKTLDGLKVLHPSSILERMKSYSAQRNLSGISLSSNECEDALEVFGTELAKGTMWALKMLDASSILPNGILLGNFFDLGAYDECVDIKVKGSDSAVSFDGQHCLVNLQLTFSTLPDIGNAGVLAALGNSVVYMFSICLPSSCTPMELSHSLAMVADEINSFISTAKVSFVIQESDCHIKERPPLDISEILGIVVTVGFLILAVLCTIIDMSLDQQYKKDLPKCIKILVAFSLYSNGRRLLDTQVGEGTIQVLHGLKFLSIAWVVMGHRVRFAVAAPSSNLLTFADLLENYSIMLILNATLSVDVFFVISGILNTYIYMNVSERGGKSNVSHWVGYVHRYIRLTPAYGLMILVTATWLYRTGDGPFWDRLVGDAKTDCTNYWWTGLLYINNYYNPNTNCMMQSWYLAADMQLFWLSPLVLYPLRRWPRVGLFNLTLLIILSIIAPFLVAYIDLIKTPIPLSLDVEKVSREMAELYFPTHTKTISYVLGILGGYVIHLIRADKLTLRISRARNLVFWSLALTSMAVGLFGGHSIFQLDSPYNRWESSLYIAFYRVLWSSGVVWIIVACTSGYGGVVSSTFSWRVFIPLGRLTYSIYLTHVAVILYGMGSLRQPQYFTFFDQILKFLGDLVIATVLAAVLSLVIESPVLVLEKIVLFDKRPRRRVSFSVSASHRRSGSRSTGGLSRQSSSSHVA